MRIYWSDLEAEYTSALRDYFAAPEEAHLHHAYELGRRALDGGLGVLDMAALYHAALQKISAGALPPDETGRKMEMAESFFVESLGPFEMTHRGFHETKAALLKLNERLEMEARRIAHALHDEGGQLIACVYIALDEIGKDLPSPSRERIQEVKGLLDRIEEELRRLSHELRPTILDDLGLVPALESLAQGIFKRLGLPVTVDGPTDSRLPFMIETVLYRVVQEALNNVMRHARASHAWVRIMQQPQVIQCSIKDDGAGFDVSAAMTRKGERGLGLIGIRERAEVLGGKLEIASEPGRGTEVTVMIPLEGQDAHTNSFGR